ncbi:MAG: 4-hydroxy-3-methylbut-2-enyl diphosphate reductase [Firmicutes bacterium]|nr:4-hydroxy-3-methylbut-2-enyl diphosphate reductase [Bacillota bacterium]
MKISIANKAGFCFGVRRAISMAYEERKNSGGKPVYTLGPLVHNPQVIEELEKDGIKTIEELEDHEIGTLIIRTHGVTPAIRKEAIALGYKIVDATCPLVKNIHDIVKDLNEGGYYILVIGHSSHPEVVGIVGQVEGECSVIEDVEDAREIERRKKLGVVVQTTALWPKFLEIGSVLIEKAQECRIFNTICHATMERQDAALELARAADAMIVVGGRNSSNTRRLLEICQSVNPNSYQVEYAHEVRTDWLDNVNTIGITAGASTPDHVITEIKEKVIELKG